MSLRGEFERTPEARAVLIELRRIYASGKRLARELFGTGSYRSRAFRFDASRRNAMALAVSFANQFQQMMIVNILDLVGENHKPTIDFIELAAFEMIPELLATKTERMAP